LAFADNFRNNSKEPLDGKSVKGILEGVPDIPRKPKKQLAPESSTTNGTNGTKHAAETEATSNALKRARLDDGETPHAKKAKTTTLGGDDDIVVVDEGADGGAILIDD